MVNTRAAVVVGVNKTGGLTPLKSAASNAASVAEWLGSIDPGYDVSLFNDDEKPVAYATIEDAIFDCASLPTRYELLLLYFSGHGLYHNRSDIWLLSKSPDRPREAVDVNMAIGLAKYCGIPNVIIVSDACRSLPENLPQANLDPGGLFPTHREIEHSTTKVDSFRATGRGTSAYEGKIDDAQASFLTHAFRLAYKKPRSEMICSVKILQKTIRVVPNRRLEDFLQDTIDEAIAEAEVNFDQQIEVSVPSDDHVFIAPADPLEEVAAAHITRESHTASDPPLTVSLTKPRAGGSDNLKMLPGVGPARETVLNDLGIFHFDQIAEMPPKDLKRLSEHPSFRILLTKHSVRAEADKLAKEAADAAHETRPARRQTLARAAASQVLAELDLPVGAPTRQPGLEIRVESEISARTPGDDRMAFESETGLLVHGAAVTDAVIGRGAGTEVVEILDHGNGRDKPAIIRFWDLQPAASVAVQCEDGHSMLVPGLRGYIGHAHIAEAGMSTLNYVPSANSVRFSEYRRRSGRIDRLRAAVALASEHGAFRLGSRKLARKIAARIRVGKRSDPTLGIYAAHAYWEASDDASVESVLRYMRSDLSADLFDVWMLSSRWPEKSKPVPVYPACPLLTQAWSLLRMKDIELGDTLSELSRNLSDSLWTTFGQGAFERLRAAIGAGEIT